MFGSSGGSCKGHPFSYPKSKTYEKSSRPHSQGGGGLGNKKIARSWVGGNKLVGNEIAEAFSRNPSDGKRTNKKATYQNELKKGIKKADYRRKSSDG